jgi:GMP synthase (glutamine-hydrolysing)
MRGLFIQHQDDVPPGLVGDRAEQRGVDVEVLRAAPGRYPDPRAYDFVVCLGSGAAAYDDTVPWLHDEHAFLRAAVTADVPVLGICFGSQILSRVLGGTVQPCPRPEIGWMRITSSAPALVDPGPWLAWHFDCLTPPPGARELARSPLATQAFSAGRHLGVQFHPEALPAAVASWAAANAGSLDRLGLSADGLVAETRRRLPAARRRAHALFDRFLAHAQTPALQPEAP